jgi:eukaryotic-like serine/threonine-protein kinase
MFRGCLMFVFTLVFVTIFSFVAGYLMYMQLGKKTEVTMPSLVGLPLEDALDQITKNDLILKATRNVKTPQFREGTVVSQSPEALTQVKVGRDVILEVAVAVEKTKLPDLRGSEIKDVAFKLTAESLPVGIEAHAYHKSVEANRIIATNPDGGSDVPRGTQVDILVSLGPRPVAYVMPDLIGKTKDQVLAQFKETPYVIGSEEVKTSDPKQRNKIISQDPAPGKRLDAQAKITLKIGQWTQ